MELLSIGKISKICDISIHRLRNYHKIGLIEPNFVDETSGRRYYSQFQIYQIDLISHLRKLNFGLDEIRKIMNNQSYSTYKEVYNLKLNSIQEEIARLQKIKISITNTLTDFEGIFGAMEKAKLKAEEKIIVKNLPERKIIYIEDKISYDKTINVITHNKLEKMIQENNILALWTPLMLFKSKKEAKSLNVDLSKIIISDNFDNADFIKKIPSGYYASTIYKGGLMQLWKNYYEIQDWLKFKNCKETGLAINILHVNDFKTTTEKDFICELQVLIE